jgi:hypothetical protein
MQVTQGSVFTDPGATVTDNVDATRVITGNGTVNTSTLGFYSLIYSANDREGNVAAPVSRVVNVVLPTN